MRHSVDGSASRVIGIERIQVYNNKGQPKMKGHLFIDLVGENLLVKL